MDLEKVRAAEQVLNANADFYIALSAYFPDRLCAVSGKNRADNV